MLTLIFVQGQYEVSAYRECDTEHTGTIDGTTVLAGCLTRNYRLHGAKPLKGSISNSGKEGLSTSTSFYIKMQGRAEAVHMLVHTTV